MTTDSPHDVFDEEDPRIAPEDRRYPRVVVVSMTHDGQRSWGELNQHGEVEETTLTGVVLDAIQQYLDRWIPCGEVYVDGIPYQYVSDRPKP